MLRGRFEDTTGAPYIEGRLILTRLSLSVDISFLVDTGADMTVLCPSDAAKITLDYDLLTDEAETSRHH